MKQALFLFCLSALLPAAARSNPLSLSLANPHYFEYGGRTIVLVTSGEHYGAVINAGFDQIRYLDTLAQDHLNLTRLWTGTYHEVPGSFHIGNNTLAPPPDRFLAPWMRSGNRFDLTRWNPAFFARLHQFLKEASRRGIIVELNLFCAFYDDSMWNVSPLNAANNVNHIGAVPRSEVLSLQHPALLKVEDDFTRKIVREVNSFDNLYFEICNEPWAGHISPAWQRHISQVIVDTERHLPKRHLISQNVANNSLKILNPDPNVSIFNFHYARPPEAVAENYGLNKPIGCNETGFDGQSDSTYRIQGWAFLAAGGALFNNLDYSFTVGHEDGTFRYDPKTPGGGSPRLRRQLGVLGQFFRSLPLQNLRPAAGAILPQPQEPVHLYTLAQSGKLYIAYLYRARMEHNLLSIFPADNFLLDRKSGPSSVILHLPAGSYQAAWIDPSTGNTIEQIRISETGAPMSLSSPVFVEDMALKIWR